MSSIITGYNPDVLSCLANLSNDEVFTPPEVANAMLDILPQELFRDPNTKFLDPACKSGVFLREIAKRLIDGLAKQIPNLQRRIDHICQNQLYGIAITELTSLLSRRSLYCSKYPNSIFSVSKFDNQSGNIRYKRIQHRWQGGKCIFCGAIQDQYDRDDVLETYAYELIHTVKPEDIFNMKFDVIISNPPYQLSAGGAKAQAIPLYNRFVEQAKKLNPRYMTMIIPSRWFSGGLGLDTFRDMMISDKRIRFLYDYINSSDCFAGVQIKGGVCYFLWDRDNPGMCEVTTNDNGNIEQSMRYLEEDGSGVYIRRSQAISIYHKVMQKKEKSFDVLVSGTKPFGLPTTYHGSTISSKGNDIVLYERNGTSFIRRDVVMRNKEWIDKYKVFITRAYGAGEDFPHQIINKPLYGGTHSCCNETYIVIGPFINENECKNVISYLSTKFVRFMIMLKKPAQDALKKVYGFVPMQDFSKPWTDEELYAKYDLSDEEIAFIDSMIRPMELGGDVDA